MADRYTYTPSIGFFIILAWGADELSTMRRFRKTGLRIVAGIALAALLICTRTQVRHWKNSLTLFGHAVEVTKSDARMCHDYGEALYENGRPKEAVTYLKQAVQIDPQYSQAHYTLGNVYARLGNIKEAVASWNEVLALQPGHLLAINNLAWVKATHQNPDFYDPNEAVRLALRVCELTNYEQPEALDTLAVAYAATGRFPQAIETAEKAVQLSLAKNKDELARLIQRRLQSYKAGRPYRR
jgi:Flp pilus assembly protein TadD